MIVTDPRIRRSRSVDWIDPALELAFAWANEDPARMTPDNVYAFVDMCRAIERYRREVRRG